VGPRAVLRHCTTRRISAPRWSAAWRTERSSPATASTSTCRR
jgi:hypothetical protein